MAAVRPCSCSPITPQSASPSSPAALTCSVARAALLREADAPASGPFLVVIML